MGCWSESCALSGLEISCGEKAYMASVVPNKYEKHVYDFLTPPILGDYDDYGGIENLAEDFPFAPFNLKKGDRLDRDKIPSDGYPLYIAASVFDFLPKLKPEFVFKDTPKTLGPATEKYLKKISDHLKVKFPNDDIGQFNKIAHDYKFREIIGMETTSYGGFRNASEIVEQYGEPYLPFLGRIYMLRWASTELRKNLAPTHYGPQHNGEQALIPFYRHVLKVSLDRKKRWEEF